MSVKALTDKKWDLIVVGGGFAGVAAAVAAKRHGLCNVLIVDKAGFLGGAAATMLINPFMPYSTKVDGQPFDLCRGFFTELCGILRETGGQGKADGPVKNCLHEEYVKIAMDRLAKKEGIQPLFHAYLCGVEKDSEHLKSVKVATKAGILDLCADYFIDATGDADLAVLSGCPFRLGRSDGLCQPMTLCFRVGNVDVEKFMEHKPDMQKIYREWQEEGKITNPRENVLVFRTLVDGMLHFNTTRIVKLNPTDPLDVTTAEAEAREQMLEIVSLLRECVPGCENCRLLYSAGEIGVRESRMIDGEYLLTGEDLRNCVRFGDSVAAGNYDIDIHNPEGTGTSHYYFPAGQWYTIPYRCLVPKNADNLLVTGRCISVTHEAQASIRIMPITTVLGEAAGIAAAVAARTGAGVKDADIGEIRKLITAGGGFVG